MKAAEKAQHPVQEVIKKEPEKPKQDHVKLECSEEAKIEKHL